MGSPGLLGEKLVGKSPLAACLFFCAPVGPQSFPFLAGQKITERTSFVEFPARTGQWRWYVSLLGVATERALGLDDCITGNG